MNESSWVVSSGEGIFSGGVTTSGANFAWSNGGMVVGTTKPQLDFSTADGSVFVFNGFNARLGWPGSATATIRGYRGDTLLFDETFSLSQIFMNYEFNFSKVDRIAIHNAEGRNILFDDIEFNRENVPEPGSIFLLSIGLLAQAILFRNRQCVRSLK